MAWPLSPEKKSLLPPSTANCWWICFYIIFFFFLFYCWLLCRSSIVFHRFTHSIGFVIVTAAKWDLNARYPAGCRKEKKFLINTKKLKWIYNKNSLWCRIYIAADGGQSAAYGGRVNCKKFVCSPPSLPCGRTKRQKNWNDHGLGQARAPSTYLGRVHADA